MKHIENLKKIFVLGVAALSISIVYVGPASAVTAEITYLQQIAQNTYGLLQVMQNPANLAGLAVSWLQQDTGNSSITTQAQQSLATSGWSYITGQIIITAIQKQIMADILGVPTSAFDGKNPPILANLPDVNDVSYSTLLGTPPAASLPVDFYGYVKNAAGFNYTRPIPDTSWSGDSDSQAAYKAYFNTVTAVESFNAYLISQVATDSLLKADQNTQGLIALASSSSFIAQIATEELGRVLRQILLFTSQSFVVNAQLQIYLREMVAAQAMTNSMLIKLNGVNEYNLLRNAKGKDAASSAPT